MSIWARWRSMAGGDRDRYQLTAAATMALPDSSNFFELTGTATVTSLGNSLYLRNRLVLFYQTSGTTTFTNTNSTTTAGQMDLNGANINLSQGDVLGLFCRTDGVWVKAFVST